MLGKVSRPTLKEFRIPPLSDLPRSQGGAQHLCSLDTVHPDLYSRLITVVPQQKPRNILSGYYRYHYCKSRVLGLRFGVVIRHQWFYGTCALNLDWPIR